MLTITIPACEEKDEWDDKNQQFYHINAFRGCVLTLEHSLISISKWESKWHVPFLNNKNITEEQTLYYIKCMTINQGVPDEAYEHLTAENFKDISEYINDPMTATTVKDVGSRRSNEIVTSELIYYWMIALQIPSAYEKWHINRLLQLIAVCNAKNQPAKKMSKNEIIERNRALNEARRAKYKTKG